MSICPAHPRPVCGDRPRPPLLYWPVLVSATAVAGGFVVSCVAVAWLLSRPDRDARTLGTSEVVQASAADGLTLPRVVEPKRESEPPAAPKTKVTPPRPAPPPLPPAAVESLPGDTVGKRRE